jgi:hypothetical protein
MSADQTPLRDYFLDEEVKIKLATVNAVCMSPLMSVQIMPARHELSSDTCQMKRGPLPSRQRSWMHGIATAPVSLRHYGDKA